MEIKEILDKNFALDWDNFIIAQSSPASFLQSWQWGEFKNKTQDAINAEKKLFRYAIYDDKNKLMAVVQFIKIGLPGKKFYLNCPRGPVIRLSAFTESSVDKSEIIKLLINKIRQELNKDKKIIFVRFAPPYTFNIWGATGIKLTKVGLIKPKILINLKEPENTLILNLQHSEEEILKNMRQKTRYNIKLAERKGIKIKIKETGRVYQTNPNKNLITEKETDIFYKLLKETAKRNKINIFEKKYYNKLLQTAGDNLRIALFIAEYNAQPLSSIIAVGFGDTATYLYGASSNQHRELMPNYLIQWKAIKWAKQNNYKYYDFWGISRQKKDWAGITRFKQGFVSQKTGKEINYLGAFDYILNKKWHALYKFGKIFTSLIKN